MQWFFVCLLLVFSAGCVRSSPPKPAQTDAGAIAGGASGLSALIQEELDAELRFSPTQATWLGDHSSDESLDDVRLDAVFRESARIANLQQRTQRFAEALKPPLSVRIERLERPERPERIEPILLPEHIEKEPLRLDTLLLLARLEALRIERDELRPFERNPHFYSGIVAWGLDGLMSHSLASENGLRALRGRLLAIPSVLKEAQRNLKNPPELWVKRSIEGTQATRDFVATVLPRVLAALRGPDPKLGEEMLRLREETQRALEDHLSFLSRDVLPRSKGDWTIPRERLLQRLRALELIDVSLETVLAIAEQEHAKTKERAEELARELGEQKNSGRAMNEAMHDIEEDHPKAEELVAQVEQIVRESFALLADGALGPLPTARPRVAEMPPFRFGYLQLVTAAPLETDREPLLQLDPIDQNWPNSKDKKQIADHLRMLNRTNIQCWVLRDVVPGRLLQVSAHRQRQGGLSPIRWRGHSLALVEGWPQYSAERAAELLPKGDAQSRVSLLLARHRLLLLGRLIVSLRLHPANGNNGAPTPNQRLDEAARFFAEDCLLDEYAARREAERGTYDPLFGLPALGLLQLEQLRDDVRLEQHDLFSSKHFHDAVLSAGPIPITALRRFLLKTPGTSLQAKPNAGPQAKESPTDPQSSGRR